ncbi:hypothetical protein [Streptomyces sp. R35]|uniref:Uncharacterized protein n=1 Tax=Streptomyces sp. R35 TaxID=3238630 RepID=A0AB39SL49_9ACTN
MTGGLLVHGGGERPAFQDAAGVRCRVMVCQKNLISEGRPPRPHACDAWVDSDHDSGRASCSAT